LIAALLLPGVALAQTGHSVMNGVDSRVPPLEMQYMAQQIATLSQQLALMGATLTVAKDDATEVQKQLDAVTAYWKAWCGERPGC
jgi:hypothetical protein